MRAAACARVGRAEFSVCVARRGESSACGDARSGLTGGVRVWCSGHVVGQAVTNIRTVASLNLQVRRPPPDTHEPPSSFLPLPPATDEGISRTQLMMEPAETRRAMLNKLKSWRQRVCVLHGYRNESPV